MSEAVATPTAPVDTWSLWSAGQASPRSGFRFILKLSVIALLYLGAAKFGFTLAFATSQVTAVWPPTGIALVALLLFGSRAWPGIFVGALLANAISHEPLPTAAGIAVGNTLGPVVGAFLLRRFAFDERLARTRDVFALFGTALVCMTITATNGVANLALGGIVPWSAYRSIWWVWWTGDAMGIVVFAPLLLSWATAPHHRESGWRIVELGALTIALAALCHVAFSGALLTPNSRIEYAVFPMVIWAALRFGQREAASALAIISGCAIWGAIHDRGPFAAGTLDQRLILLDIFLAVVALTAMSLSAITAERRRVQGQLVRANDELEMRVVDRTAALAAANADLTRVNQDLGVTTRELAEKNEEVEAFVYIVSHDLRAPLVNLQGFSKELDLSCRELEDVLQDAAVPATVGERLRPILANGIRGSLRYISASTTKFQRLIDALLVLSRSGRHDYRSEEIDIDGLVRTSLDSLRQSIDESGTTISVRQLPPVQGDTTAIGQVFSNLVGNALKYRQPGRPGLVEIGGETEDAMVHYWVRDNGAGIPAGAQRRLFQVFQRFHPTLASGEGMGLAIVKRVVEKHGGKVWADSQEGVGTTFHLTLPAVPSQASAP